MSLAFVGRIVQSLKGFYNGINPATLTGAIDVVIVKQPDGTYHSSPFHVRFGKLGVLRSREKVVDIEINGESIDLQMKLGEAGEAFFVQEIESEEDDEVPEYLATSPLPSAESLAIMEEGVQELHRQVAAEEAGLVNPISIRPRSRSTGQSHAGSHLTVTATIDITANSSGGKPRRKVLKKKKQHQKQASASHHHHHGSHHKSSGRSSIRTTVSMPEGVAGETAIFDFEESTSDESSESTLGDIPLSGSAPGSKCYSSTPDVQSLDVERELRTVELQGTTSHRRMSSLGKNSFIATPFSDPETSPICSPQPSRPSTPKSDTEVDKQHCEESQTSALMENSATWDWGMFPTNLEAEVSTHSTSSLSSSQKQKSTLPEDVAGASQAVVQVLPDGERKDDDHTAKSSGGFMSIWNKPSSTSTSQTTAVSSTSGKLDGIYLDDLTSMDDPEMARIYLGRPRETEEDTESGRGQSLPQSPNSVEGSIGGPVSFTMSEVRHLGPVALSLCGGLGDPESLTLDKFMQKVVTFDDLALNPNITTNPDLVVKIHDKFYNWTTAGPMVLSQIVFHKQLPDPAVKDLEKEHMPRKKKKKGWFSWGRSAEEGITTDAAASAVSIASTSSAADSTGIPGSTSAEGVIPEESEVLSSPVESPSSTPPTSAKGTPRKHRIHKLSREEATTSTETDTDLSEKEVSSSPPQLAASASDNITTTVEATKVTVSMTTTTDMSPPAATSHVVVPAAVSDEPKPDSVSTTVTIELHEGERTGALTPDPLDDEELEMAAERRRRHSSQCSGRAKREKFIKSLRLSSDQISKMGLREGHNEIVFSVTTQYQGTTRCVSNVYLWNYDDKIVISDIDGTITKSDVLGQVMPIIGRDWFQSGVAQLFTRIDQNGYKLIYLSARAIGQSRSTKDMLKSIRQGGLVLPNGPLFLNPTSLFSAFHREVILKNPEEFKISCLKDIADLFPSSPFIAGFGNKVNDVIAYRALDIPKSRIFTINPQGQLRNDLSLTFLSSYTDMSDLVDHLFPARDHVERGAASEFTGVTYWRHPIPALSDTELALLGGDKSKTVMMSTVVELPTVEAKLEVIIEAPRQ